MGEWDQDKVHIRVLRPSEPFRFGVTVPGETESDEFGWKITARQHVPSKSDQQRTSLTVELPQEKIQGNLYFRSCQPGDTIQPFGFEGTRKVSDVLSEARLTQAARARLPIICDFLGPIWIPGVFIAQNV